MGGKARYVEIKISDLTDSQPIRIEHNDHGILVVKIGNNIYAADDECPHEGCYLSDGHLDIEDKTITCLCHWATFSLENGESLTPDVTKKPLKLYRIRVSGDRIVVELD
jgi:3-phenylpropionate/trans-cinnamate dioxygenase ferredoxin subunit